MNKFRRITRQAHILVTPDPEHAIPYHECKDHRHSPDLKAAHENSDQ
jgi:hypothetical protein